MERVDIAILGTGPAGLEAAITATIRNKKILLIGSKLLSSKVGKAHAIQNYLGLPAIAGEDLKAAFQAHLDSMGIEITEDKVSAVYSMGDYFSIQAANATYEATTVILATGVVLGKPYPGEDQFVGRGVSYCATCDAPLYKGKTVAIVGDSPKEEAEVDFMAEVAGKVYYFPLYQDPVQVSDQVEVIHEIPTEIIGKMKADTLKTRDGSYDVDGIFLLRNAVAPDKLVPGLEVDGAHVKVDRTMAGSLPGLFACGDIVGKPYQYIKAAGEGNVAALSAVDYLAELKRAQA
ncbi:MAG: NAD(P)/FAD-dependent oxidoreductase [Lachnospiraceae bacterium]|nr:NAD(P)/FAD-dependent oxidoreductase [Lachnospiraceae bacterium]